MTPLLGHALFLAIALGGAVTIVLATRALTAATRLLPSHRAVRARAFLPLFASAVALLYLATILRWLIADPRWEWLAPVAIMLFGVGAGWKALRDAFDGLVIQSSGVYRVGDLLQVGTLEGQIAELGWRYMIVETRDGTVATIPYSQLSEEVVQRRPRSEQAHFHVFRVPLPDRVAAAEVKRAVRRALLLSPWCLYRRDPQVRAAGDELEVVVGLVDADHEAEAERAVRRTIEGLAPAS